MQGQKLKAEWWRVPGAPVNEQLVSAVGDRDPIPDPSLDEYPMLGPDSVTSAQPGAQVVEAPKESRLSLYNRVGRNVLTLQRDLADAAVLAAQAVARAVGINTENL